MSGLLRRIRRRGDLSQRDLARQLGVSVGAIGQAESGRRDVPARLLCRAATLVGLRVTLADQTGTEVPAMALDAVRDAGGRRYPAHLDTRFGDQDWWHGEQRYDRQQPWYTFDRVREVRDDRRRLGGTPDGHLTPGPADAPEERARTRARAACDAREDERRRRRDARARAGHDTNFGWGDPDCGCPPGCDELLLTEDPAPAREQAHPHVADCPCRCDIG
ncbi:helix-turn-helix domain-containing protein [Modestobacter sp. SYSU DS0511]